MEVEEEVEEEVDEVRCKGRDLVQLVEALIAKQSVSWFILYIWILIFCISMFYN